MCGIAGVCEFDPAARADGHVLARMASVIAHRGPDDEGIRTWGPVGLAHRRLAIIDLTSGHQPMLNASGSIGVVFNGEIYNFQDLRRALAQRGRVFRTTSDTEVVLAAYEAWGDEAVARLDGMFALAIWDDSDRRLLLARDRLGKKPLFYYHDGRRLIFASELKSVLCHPGVQRELSVTALDAYLSHTYIPAPDSIFTGVKKLEPGHLLTVENGRVTERRYWALAFRDAPPPSEADCLDTIDRLVQRAVRGRLLSDVPVGAFLSGGLDSSLVVGMMARFSERPVKTFTIGFDERGFSELDDARVVARHFGTEHHELIVEPSAVDLLADMVWHFDEPFADASAIPTYYVCKMAAEKVKVVLSGDGGDEVFAGYTRYVAARARRVDGVVPGWVRRAVLQPLVRRLPIEWPGRNRLYGLAHGRPERGGYGLGVYPYVKDALVGADFRATVARSGDAADALWEEAATLPMLSRLQWVDTMSYLPNDILVKLDRMSMAHSLEVRSPLLDHHLVEYMASLPPELKVRGGMGKYLLRRYASRWLPRSVLEKKKQGFAVPAARWFRKELAPFAREVLLDPQTLSRGYVRPSEVRRMLRSHQEGRRDYSVWIWLLLVLEFWHRVFWDAATRRI